MANEHTTEFFEENILKDNEAFKIIDEQFEKIKMETLKKDVMKEMNILVQSMVQDEIQKWEITNGKQEQLSDFNPNPMDFSINDYMYHMKKEIDFLRKQVESRDELIESLLDQSSQNSLNKVSTHSLHSKQNSKSPEKNVNFPRDSFTKPKENAYNSQNVLTVNEVNHFFHKNRFDSLSHETNNSDDNENHILDESNITNRNKRKGILKEKTKNDKPINRNSKSNDERKVVSILGDSIVKELNGYEMSNTDTRVIVKSFSGATTACMQDYIKPSMKFKPDMVILHCGTNDLKLNEDSDDIANKIINLAVDISNTTTVAVSELVSRNDKFGDRVSEVLSEHNV